MLMNILCRFVLLALIVFGTQVLSQTSISAQEHVLQGRVIEMMHTVKYTYLQIQTADNTQWAAIPLIEENSITKGDEVRLQEGMVMENFYSKAFDRTFERVIFSAGIAPENPLSPVKKSAASTDDFASAVAAEEADERQGEHAATQLQSSGSSGATVPFLAISVEKSPAKNGITVEEAFAEAEKLNGETVQIRGKVVKVNNNIMARNWVHIQDGSGDPMNNSHDLVVTTQESIPEGEIVHLKGTLAAKRDFGYGYAYDVLIENGQLVE